MWQMWHYMLCCSCSAHAHPLYTDQSETIGRLLAILYHSGIDWTNLDLWPEEVIEGLSVTQNPIIPLLDGAPDVVIALCAGKVHMICNVVSVQWRRMQCKHCNRCFSLVTA